MRKRAPSTNRELAEERLAWIWASARSGSTWLLQLLAHPLKVGQGAADPGDELGFTVPPGARRPIDLVPVNTSFLANHLAPAAGQVMEGAPYEDDWTARTFGRYTHMEDRANYLFARQYADVWGPKIRELVLARYGSQVQRLAAVEEVADPIVVLKEVAGAHAADEVMALFGRSPMVFLARDGRDVVDSQMDAASAEGWLPRTTEAGPSRLGRADLLRERCRAWVGDMTTILRAYESHPEELRLMVRYEDLLDSTVDVLGTVADRIGLRRNRRWAELSAEANAFDRVPAHATGKGKFHRAATPGLWRRNLSEDEQRVTMEIMGPMLRTLGYES